MSIMLSFILWLLIGIATAYVANQRGRDPYIWFAVGMFLGLLGLLLLVLLPSVSKEQEPSAVDDKTSSQLFGGPVLEIKPLPIDHEYLIKEWYCLDKSRQQQGPMSFDALKSLWNEGKIDLVSYVWCEGMDNWKKIEELPYLNAGLSH